MNKQIDKQWKKKKKEDNYTGNQEVTLRLRMLADILLDLF